MDNLLTVQDVADVLQLSTSTIYKYAENGRLPSCRIGTRRRFSSDAIESFVRANTTSNTSNPQNGQEK